MRPARELRTSRMTARSFFSLGCLTFAALSPLEAGIRADDPSMAAALADCVRFTGSPNPEARLAARQLPFDNETPCLRPNGDRKKQASFQAEPAIIRGTTFGKN